MQFDSQIICLRFTYPGAKLYNILQLYKAFT